MHLRNFIDILSILFLGKRTELSEASKSSWSPSMRRKDKVPYTSQELNTSVGM